MKASVYSPRRTMRMMVIMVIYSSEIFQEKPSIDQIFESDKFDELFNYKLVFKNNTNQIKKEQYKIISSIEKNYELLIRNINKYIRDDWKWERMSPLLRSILLCASIELWKLDIGIVTNEYVEITKDFFPNGNEYKFINEIIEKIGKEYSEYKNKKKS